MLQLQQAGTSCTSLSGREESGHQGDHEWRRPQGRLPRLRAGRRLRRLHEGPGPAEATVRACPRFCGQSVANTRSTNRFRLLTLDDLADVAQDASARRDVGPAVLSTVAPRAPIGQGETVAVANVALKESADHHVLHSPTHDFDLSPL